MSTLRNKSKLYARALVSNLSLQASALARSAKRDLRYAYDEETDVCLRKVGTSSIFEPVTTTDFIVVEETEELVTMSNGVYEAEVRMH